MSLFTCASSSFPLLPSTSYNLLHTYFQLIIYLVYGCFQPLTYVLSAHAFAHRTEDAVYSHTHAVFACLRVVAQHSSLFGGRMMVRFVRGICSLFMSGDICGGGGVTYRHVYIYTLTS